MNLYEKNKVQYEQELKRTQEILASASMSFKLSRSFRMNGFGVFNWDCFFGNPNAVLRTYSLSYQGENVQTASIYLYRSYNKNPAMVRQKSFASGKGQVKFSPTEKSHLLVILPNDQIGVVTANELSDLNNNDQKTLEISKMHTIKNLNDIDLIINSI